MSISKTIGVISIIGGVASIGWFVLNKNKPKLSTDQLSSLKKDLEDKSIVDLPKIKTPLEQWQEKYSKFTELQKKQLNKSDIANLGFSIESDGTIGYNSNDIGQKLRVEHEFPNSTNCKNLDVSLRNIILKIAEEGQKLLTKKPNKIYFEALQKHKVTLQNTFTTNQCSIKIENQRLDESGLVLTKQAIETEESLKENSYFDQNIFIGVGGILLFTGTFLMLKE